MKNNFFLYLSCSFLALYLQNSFFANPNFKYYFIFRVGIVLLLIVIMLSLIFRIQKISKRQLISTYMFTCCYLLFYFESIGPKTITVLICVILVSLLNNFEKRKLYLIFYRVLAVMVLISLFGYIMVIVGYQGGTEVFNSFKPGYVYERYLLNLMLRYKSTGYLLYRFQSIFNEPGELGTILGMLILFDNGEKKLKVWRGIVIIGGVLTLSLAFYIFLLAKFLTLNIKLSKKFFICIVLGCIFLNSGTILKKYGNDEIYYRIYERIYKFKFSRKDIESDKILNYFYNNANVLIGTRRSIYEEKVFSISSIENIIYEKGYIGLALMCLSIFTLTDYINLNKKNKVKVLIFMLSMYQRPNLLEFCYVLILLTGISWNKKGCKYE